MTNRTRVATTALATLVFAGIAVPAALAGEPIPTDPIRDAVEKIWSTSDECVFRERPDGTWEKVVCVPTGYLTPDELQALVESFDPR